MSEFPKVHYLTLLGQIVCGIGKYPGIDYAMIDWEQITCPECLEKGFSTTAHLMFRENWEIMFWPEYTLLPGFLTMQRAKVNMHIQTLKDIVARERENKRFEQSD